MNARMLGMLGGGLLGLAFGSGTGIVGLFGGVAGVFVFTPIGAIWGFSAGPDIARFISNWLSRNSK